jgi:DNA-binding CsgD family transcriptional regulator
VIALSPKAALPAKVLEALFDLTPAAARVAALIASGNTIPEAATTLSIKTDTVRVHLKAVYAKTGVHRQAELARLLTK